MDEHCWLFYTQDIAGGRPPHTNWNKYFLVFLPIKTSRVKLKGSLVHLWTICKFHAITFAILNYNFVLLSVLRGCPVMEAATLALARTSDDVDQAAIFPALIWRMRLPSWWPTCMRQSLRSQPSWWGESNHFWGRGRKPSRLSLWLVPTSGVQQASRGKGWDSLLAVLIQLSLLAAFPFYYFGGLLKGTLYCTGG